MKLGENLFHLRKKNHLSQEELAEKIKVTRQTISNWKLGETVPNPEQLKQLSKEFNISIDELLDNDIRKVIEEKISNTEKLAGMIIKILKAIGIAILVLFMIDIFYFFLFTFVKFTNYDHGTKKKTSIRCTFHEKEYSYELTYFEESGKIIESSGDSYLIHITNTKNVDNSYQLMDQIDAYIKNNGGNCNRKDLK